MNTQEKTEGKCNIAGIQAVRDAMGVLSGYEKAHTVRLSCP